MYVCVGAEENRRVSLLESSSLYRQYPERDEGGDVADGLCESPIRGFRIREEEGARGVHGKPRTQRLSTRRSGG